MCRQVLTTISTLVIAGLILQAANGQENKEGEELVLSIKDDQKTQYLNHNFETNVYNYGYEINPDGQFHHEIHGSDGVTYGCYGYVDPFGLPTATFYISDGWGYRVVHPRQDVEIFLHEHEHHESNSESNNHDHNDNHDNHEHHEHHGVVTPWGNLEFPRECGNFEDISMHPIRPPPSKPGPIGSETSGVAPTQYPQKPSQPTPEISSGNFPNQPDQSQTEIPLQTYPESSTQSPASIPESSSVQTSRPISSTNGKPTKPDSAFPKPTHPSHNGNNTQPENTSQVGNPPQIDSPARPTYPTQTGTPTQGYPPQNGLPSQPGYPTSGNEYPQTGSSGQPQYPMQAGLPTSPTYPQSGSPTRPSYPSQVGIQMPTQSTIGAIQPGYPTQTEPNMYPGTETNVQPHPSQTNYPSQSGPENLPKPEAPTHAPSSPGHPSKPGKPAHGHSKPGSPKPARPQKPSHTYPKPGRPSHVKPSKPTQQPLQPNYPIPSESSAPGYVQPEYPSPIGSEVPSRPPSQNVYPISSTPNFSSTSPTQPVYPMSSNPSYQPSVPSPERPGSRPGKPSRPSSRPGYQKPGKPSRPSGHQKPQRPEKPPHSKPQRPAPSTRPPNHQTPSNPGYPTHRPSESSYPAPSKPETLPQRPSRYPTHRPSESSYPAPSKPETLPQRPSRIPVYPSNQPEYPLAPRPIPSQPAERPGSSQPGGSYRPPTQSGYPTAPHPSNPTYSPSQSGYSTPPQSIGPSRPSSQSGYPATSKPTEPSRPLPSKPISSVHPPTQTNHPALSKPETSPQSEYPSTSQPATNFPETSSPYYPDSSKPDSGKPDNSGLTQTSFPSTPGLNYPEYPNTVGSYPEYVDPSNPNPPSSFPSQFEPTNSNYGGLSDITGTSGSLKGPDGSNGSNGDIGGDGVGPLVLDGTWPTGDPGPNGPWPEDPVYNTGNHGRTYEPYSLNPDIPIGSGTSIPTEPKYYQKTLAYGNPVENSEELRYSYDKTPDSLYGGLYPAPFTLTENSPSRNDTREDSQEFNQENYKDVYNNIQHGKMLQIVTANDDQEKDKSKTESGSITGKINVESKKMDEVDGAIYQNHEEPNVQNGEFMYQVPKYNGNYKNAISTDQRQIDLHLTPPYEYKEDVEVDKQFKQLKQSFPEINEVKTTTEQSTTTFAASGVQPPGPIQIKPISLPIGPNPEICPCYIVESNNSTRQQSLPSSTTTTTTTTVKSISSDTPVYGQLGFIPVIFVPYCFGDEEDNQDTMRSIFPSVTPISYPCSMCNNIQNNNPISGEYLNLSKLGNIRAIKRVLSEANLGYLNVPVISSSNARSRRQKAK